jgi:hypothetical protein
MRCAKRSTIFSIRVRGRPLKPKGKSRPHWGRSNFTPAPNVALSFWILLDHVKCHGMAVLPTTLDQLSTEFDRRQVGVKNFLTECALAMYIELRAGSETI